MDEYRNVLYNIGRSIFHICDIEPCFQTEELVFSCLTHSRDDYIKRWNIYSISDNQRITKCIFNVYFNTCI